MYLIFFDGECALCNRSVRFVLAKDKKKRFYFAPLGGETAKQMGITEMESLVLCYNEKVLTKGKAVLRINWLLGGKYRLWGWLSYLPSEPFDFLYRFVARFRYSFPIKKVDPDFEGRLKP